MPRIYSTSFERIIWLGQSAAKVDGFDNDAIIESLREPVAEPFKPLFYRQNWRWNPMFHCLEMLLDQTVDHPRSETQRPQHAVG